MTKNNSTYKRLGDYIREVDVRNTKSEVNLSQGICNQKYFQNPRQVSATPHLDKIVRKGQFAYNRATTRNGNKISIAYREGEDCTVSSAYCVFYIIDEEKLNPYYLWLWFKRPDFDRYAIFKSHRSAHEFFEFETLCDTYVPIPPIEEQRKIVDHYLAIQNRIANNKQTIAKLEEAAQALYRKMFVDGIDVENLPEGWRMGTIGDFGEVVTGKTPSSNNPEDFGVEVQFVTPGDFKGNRFVCTTERYLSKEGTNKLKNKIICKNDIAVTCIGSDMGKVVIATENCISNQQINAIRINRPEYRDYLYVTIFGMKDLLLDLGSGSSTLPMLNKGDFESISIIVPPNDLLVSYAKKSGHLSYYNLLVQHENEKLKKMLSVVMA